jgi:hypothetical protein
VQIAADSRSSVPERSPAATRIIAAVMIVADDFDPCAGPQPTTRRPLQVATGSRSCLAQPLSAQIARDNRGSGMRPRPGARLMPRGRAITSNEIATGLDRYGGPPAAARNAVEAGKLGRARGRLHSPEAGAPSRTSRVENTLNASTHSP